MYAYNRREKEGGRGKDCGPKQKIYNFLLNKLIIGKYIYNAYPIYRHDLPFLWFGVVHEDGENLLLEVIGHPLMQYKHLTDFNFSTFEIQGNSFTKQLNNKIKEESHQEYLRFLTNNFISTNRKEVKF